MEAEGKMNQSSKRTVCLPVCSKRQLCGLSMKRSLLFSAIAESFVALQFSLKRGEKKSKGDAKFIAIIIHFDQSVLYE